MVCYCSRHGYRPSDEWINQSSYSVEWEWRGRERERGDVSLLILSLSLDPEANWNMYRVDQIWAAASCRYI
jgi:hypothetical protein